MAIIEKAYIKKSLTEIFNKDFIDSISEGEDKIFPVNVIFVRELNVKDKKKIIPITLSHDNSKDVSEKVLHVEAEDENILNKFINILEEKND